MELVSPKDILSINKNFKYFGGEKFAELLLKVLKLDEINDLYSPVSTLNRSEFVEHVFKILNVKISVPESDLQRIPREGPFVTISNHPYGGIDGLILMKLLPPIRPDFKILSNFLLTRITPIKDIFLAVNPFESHKDVRSSLSGLKEAFYHLRAGSPLGIYPSGEVSTYRFDTNLISDREWQSSVLKFIKKTKVPVIPIYFDGNNSFFFHFLGLFHPGLRTIKLPSELLNKHDKTIEIRIGNPISLKDQDTFSDINKYGRFLRAKTYCLSASINQKKSYCLPNQTGEKIIEATPEKKIIEEIKALNSKYLLLNIKDNYVFCAPSKKIPLILEEIGRLREITYREVGEGTNKSKDIDEFDEYFDQLFIWDDKDKKIVGGYRAGKGKDILKSHGLKGFYINSLFKIKYDFLPILGETIELGRSFIVKEYQKKPISLFLLWKGILYLLLKNPTYRYLIGPVSISNEYSDFSKAMAVEFIKANHFNYEYAVNIKPRKKIKYNIPKTIDKDFLFHNAIKTISAFDKYVQDIEPDFKTPILLKKYIKLNAEIIGFNIDQKFNNCLDGLMILDLLDVPIDTIESLSKEMNDDSILDRFRK